jgi:molybdopterin molybdotransferase
MIPVSEARQYVLSKCRTLDPERVAVDDAAGRVLGEVVRAAYAVPPFANSAMDGYAVRAADTRIIPARMEVAGTIMAGDHPSVDVSTGQAVRIMTGAPLPRGADSVCMVERTHEEAGGTVVVIEDAVEVGQNVRNAGEDIAAGAEVFAPGTSLRSAHVGVLASLGIQTVVAYPRPTVGVLSTGDELSTGSDPLQPGKIRDANRPALLAQLRADGFRSEDLGVVGDDEGRLVALLSDAGSRCDAVVASGGVSVGDRDVMKIVLAKLSESTTRSMQIAVKPAKPLAFGLLEQTGTPVFGLPGNPVSALVSYELFVRPALRSMAGHNVLDRPRLSAVAEVDLPRRRDGKLHLLRVRLASDVDGTLYARPVSGQDSHMLRAMAEASGLGIVPDGDGVRAGNRLEVLLLDNDAVGKREDGER